MPHWDPEAGMLPEIASPRWLLVPFNLRRSRPRRFVRNLHGISSSGQRALAGLVARHHTADRAEPANQAGVAGERRVGHRCGAATGADQALPLAWERDARPERL